MSFVSPLAVMNFAVALEDLEIFDVHAVADDDHDDCWIFPDQEKTLQPQELEG